MQPGAKLALEFPCLDKILENFKTPRFTDLEWIRDTFLGLYGETWHALERNDAAMLHKWCYGCIEMKSILTSVGFKEILFHQPHWHRPTRDIRVTARK